MALPAILPVTFPAIPVLDVDAVLRRLPPEARARVAWAKKPIDGGLARLRSEALTDELVATVADDAWKPFASLARAVWESARENVDEWRARLVDDFEEEKRQLAELVEDDDSRDTLRSVFALLHSYLGLALSLPPDLIAQIDELGLAHERADDHFEPYIRALVSLMAAAETKKAGGDRQRARDLR